MHVEQIKAAKKLQLYKSCLSGQSKIHFYNFLHLKYMKLFEIKFMFAQNYAGIQALKSPEPELGNGICNQNQWISMQFGFYVSNPF